MKKLCALLAVVALVAFAAPAFAANPFMDVPMNHWAYDAVGQLAARGIISGYPDGTFKGNQPITRYEMASVTARALAVIDMEKASKQDVEMLKRLVVEFKDELDALGVKVDKIDSRVAVLEENIGGWKFWGEFRFDAKFTDGQGAYLGGTDDTDFSVSRYRIWMRKTVDDKVTFTARLGVNDGTDVNWDRYWVDVKLPWDVNMMVGRWLIDWEGDDGLYTDNDAFFTDRTLNGFYFQKSFGMGEVAAYASHGDLGLDVNALNQAVIDVDGYEYGARAKFNFNETFWLSLNGIWFSPDFINGVAANNADLQNLWAAAGVNFNSNIAFKAMYIDQDLDAFNGAMGEGKNLRAILDVKQEALKFTSLWIEYNDFDDNFLAITDDPWNNYGGGPFGRTLGLNYDSLIFVKAEQKWNDKWTTFERYGAASGNVGVEDTKNMTFGVKYYYTPALAFELAYDDIQDRQGVAGADDHLIRLRTHVKF
ncbi:S-layer homology domain-containing protein [Dethiosulfovibrio sp. F2B]|uniref:S-layer homology domain-containing protein n=1 Tax=Dethiosulfovibrio faecalis TaxID=2720018 RepID=UPI001F24EFEC|nr:S-layer homology domain-containing protein [Dethiosulfovibrio faecalis]MCF4150685.1 S-layer homology domain-containing protein [Dethiosulfovibrio faecalis]